MVAWNIKTSHPMVLYSYVLDISCTYFAFRFNEKTKNEIWVQSLFKKENSDERIFKQKFRVWDGYF